MRMRRRDWLKLGGLGSAATLLSSCRGASSTSKKNKKINGVVFMVADGMSHGVLTMAEEFSKIVHGKGTKWWELIDQPETVSGLMETSSASSYVTDSAAASSAWGGGMKVNNGSINIRPDGSESVPIMRYLKKKGFATGLVTSTSITHATPAGFAAVTKSRNDQHLIAAQYADVVDILLGGGMKYFDPSKRVDSRDALSLYKDRGYELLEDRDALLKSKSPRLLGLFSNDQIPFEVDRLNNPELLKKVPSLAEMSEAAMKRLLAGNKKFLLQIEGGRVDHGAHANDIAGLLWDQLAFDESISKVMEMIAKRDDILVIITSDHGNANPGLNGTGTGYSKTDNLFKNITKIKSSHEVLIQEWGRSKDNTAESLAKAVSKNLGYQMTPDETAALFASLTSGKNEVVEWSDQLNNPNGLLGQFTGNRTATGWTGVSHTSEPTLVSAIGPGAERFSGITRNNEVHGHLIDFFG